MPGAERLQTHVAKLPDRKTILYWTAVDAVKENRAYLPLPIGLLTTEEFFVKMEKTFSEIQEGRNRLLEDMVASVVADPDLPFCQTIQSYALADNRQSVYCSLFFAI